MIFNTFSYLYTKFDELSEKIDLCLEKINETKENKIITDVKQNINNINEEKTKNNNEIVNKEINIKKHKKRRSLKYYILKPFKYKKLLKQK